MDEQRWEDIERIAIRCAERPRSRLLPWEQRYEAALEGIFEGIAEGSRDLVGAGLNAITKATEQHARAHGLDKSGQPRRGFVIYWDPPGSDFEDRVLDPIALWQIWPFLAAIHRETLMDLVKAEGSMLSAAEYSGCSLKAYKQRLYLARKAARELWFAPELAPSRSYGLNKGAWGDHASAADRRNRVLGNRARRRAAA
jgi:hypothetical protein